MSRYLRWKLTSATYFFTVVTYRRRPLFENPHLRRLLGASFRVARRENAFELDAIVLLPDHLHVIIRPAEGTDYSTIWRRIKSFFTGRILHGQAAGVERNRFGPGRRKGEGNLWQRRFFEHTIRDESDWGRHVDYIHWNLVKHGLVRRPQDWIWTSIHRYIAKGLLVPDWPSGKDLDFPVAQE